MSSKKSFTKGIIAGLSTIGVLAAIGAAGIIADRFHIRKTCRSFYQDSQRQFEMPGLKEGFDPQDLFFVSSANVWLFSGYNSKSEYGKISPIYKVDEAGNVAKLVIQLPNGEIYRGHGAAVCATDKHAFLTVKDGYVVFDLATLLNADDGDIIRAFAHVPVELEPAFMNIQNGILYIGEFYHKHFYNTPESHWCECPNGHENPALMYAYDPSDSQESLFGFSPRPSRVYSIPGDIQGMCVMPDNRIVMSKSWGFGNSTLLVYKPDSAVTDDLQTIPVGNESDPSAEAANDDSFHTYLVAGEMVPMHYLYDEVLEKALIIPPMSEGIDSHDDQVWLANESASSIYVLGKFNDGKYVYSLPV